MNDTESADVNTEEVPADAAAEAAEGAEEVSETIADEAVVTDEGPCHKRLKIKISWQRIEQELDTTYQQLRNTVQIPGFRKGKAPVALLKKRFREQVQSDVEEDLKGRAVEEQFEAAEWKPLIGSIQFENEDFTVDNPFTFEVVFDVQPTFDLPEYKGLEIEAESVEVPETDIEREVEMICEQASTLEPIEVGKQAEGDYAVVDLALMVEEETIFERPEVVMKIGENNIDSMEIPELGEALAGAALDDVIEKSVQVPDDFPDADHREKAGTLRLTMRDAKKKVTPELDEAFLERLGVESEEDLRNKVRENLEGHRKAQEDSRQEELLSEQVGAAVEMELPESLVNQRQESLTQRSVMELTRDGKSEEEARAEVEKEGKVADQARKELVQIFVLDRLADEEKVFVTEDEVLQRLQAIATTYRQPLEQVVEQYRSGGMLPELRNGMRREKVKQMIRKKAKVSGA
ncbi:MAG: trigger factor [Planctomycetota bacterium]|nr:trigger factor [Planctomycetota bacterium]